jgi:hypothetical protein
LLRDSSNPKQKGTSKVNRNSTRRVKVESGGTGVVALVGLHALGSFADRLGLGDALSARLPWEGTGIPIHDRGKVLVQTSLVLAGGGEACSDIEHLRLGGHVFGSVPSDTTMFRTFHEITSSTRGGIAEAVAEMRSEVWRRSSVTTGTDPVLLDIDASLVEIQSENKEQSAATFKGGFGFHPMFCFADGTGETLSALLRAGNAGSNTVADHITVMDDAFVQLPTGIAILPAPDDNGESADHHLGAVIRVGGHRALSHDYPRELDARQVHNGVLVIRHGCRLRGSNPPGSLGPGRFVGQFQGHEQGMGGQEVRILVYPSVRLADARPAGRRSQRYCDRTRALGDLNHAQRTQGKG